MYLKTFQIINEYNLSLQDKLIVMTLYEG